MASTGVTPAKAGVQRLLVLTSLVLFLSGCVATAVGAVAVATVGVATAVVTAPIKVGGAVVDAVSDDEEDEEE